MAIKLNKLFIALFTLFIVIYFLIPPEAPADSNTDNTEIAEPSRHLGYLAPIFAYKGRPLNNDTNQLARS